VIHIHGGPVSGSEDQAMRFYRKRVCLVSYLAQQHLHLILAYASAFVLDSGAFTAWRKGIVLDFQAYIAWVRELSRHPSFLWALIPDVIDGSEEENDALLTAWPADLNGVPVWHMHESLDRLLRLAQHYPIVAIGSSGEFSRPGSKSWWRRARQALDIVCDDFGRPLCKLHGLRMLDPRIFTLIPFASADSANVAINVGSSDRFGIYKPPSAYIRAEVIADRIESFNAPATWDHL
jgi:hypothetical protein